MSCHFQGRILCIKSGFIHFSCMFMQKNLLLGLLGWFAGGAGQCVAGYRYWLLYNGRYILIVIYVSGYTRIVYTYICMAVCVDSCVHGYVYNCIIVYNSVWYVYTYSVNFLLRFARFPHIFQHFCPAMYYFWRKIGGFCRFSYRSVGTFLKKLTLFLESVRITHIFW